MDGVGGATLHSRRRSGGSREGGGPGARPPTHATRPQQSTDVDVPVEVMVETKRGRYQKNRSGSEEATCDEFAKVKSEAHSP